MILVYHYVPPIVSFSKVHIHPVPNLSQVRLPTCQWVSCTGRFTTLVLLLSSLISTVSERMFFLCAVSLRFWLQRNWKYISIPFDSLLTTNTWIKKEYLSKRVRVINRYVKYKTQEFWLVSVLDTDFYDKFGHITPVVFKVVRWIGHFRQDSLRIYVTETFIASISHIVGN